MPGKDAQSLRVLKGGEDQELDLLQWATIFWEHRLWIGGVTGAIFVLAALYSFLARPIYSATATVYVQSQSRQPIGNISATGVNSWSEEQKFYNSQPDIIRSRAVMQEAVDRLNLKGHEAFKGSKDPAMLMKAMVSVDVVKDSALFKITITAPYKNDVALWANTVAEVYRDRAIRDALDYISKANDVMLAEAKKMQDEYVRQQTKVTTSLQAQGSYFPENQKDILDKRIEALELKLNEVSVKETEAAAVAYQMESWQSRGGDPLSLPAVAEDPSVQDLVKQYNEMGRDLSKLLVRYTSKHPEVMKKQEEMQALRDRISKQAEVVLGGYRNQLATLRSQKSNLQTELDSLKRQGLQFVEGASRDETLTTSGAAIKKYMDLLYNKMQEMNVGASLLSSNIRIVNPAVPPGGPVKPNKKLNLLLGLLAGLVLSMGSVVVYRYLDTTVKSVDDIEKGLGLNLLSMIPTLSEETKRPAVESFQTLRTALIYASQNQQKNVILVTSASPQEGKTSVLVNLAKTLAAAGDRVLIIDCDLRRPSLSQHFHEQGPKKGLTNYLADKEIRIEECITPGGHPNLYVLTSGPIPPNPPELFSMMRFKGILEIFKTCYTWVLLDSPPCLSITDAQILAGMSDLVVLVAQYSRTQKPLLQRALVTLKRLNAQVAGVVLNQVETYSSYYYDYYYYHHYFYATGEEPKRRPTGANTIGEWRTLFRLGSKKPKKRTQAHVDGV